MPKWDDFAIVNAVTGRTENPLLRLLLFVLKLDELKLRFHALFGLSVLRDDDQ